MKVTLITQWFPPEPAYLWHDLALGLQSKGHEVTVVTAFPNYPHGKIYDGYRQSLTHSEDIDGIKVIRLPVYPDRSTSIIKRALSFISFSLSLLFVGVFRIPKSDTFLCYSPPLTVGLCTLILSKIKSTPFIINIQDLWPDTLVSSGFIQEGLITRSIDAVGKLIYKHAKSVVVISNGFKHHLLKKGVPDNEVTVIPNWSSEAQSGDVPTSVLQRERLALGIADSDFVVTFAGNMGPAQDMKTVLSSFDQLNKQNIKKTFKLLLVGDGLDVEALKNMKVENVIFAGRKGASEMALYYGLSDALILHLKDNPLFRITVPHKLLTYMMTGKPIVAAVNGEVNSIVAAAAVGVTADSGDAASIAIAIKKVMDLDDHEKSIIAKSAVDYYQQNFDQQALISKWDELLY